MLIATITETSVECGTIRPCLRPRYWLPPPPGVVASGSADTSELPATSTGARRFGGYGSPGTDAVSREGAVPLCFGGDAMTAVEEEAVAVGMEGALKIFTIFTAY